MTFSSSKSNSVAKLTLKDVSKTFPGSRRQSINVLHNINLEVRQSEFLCLVGPSGCGKTTLLSILAGLERASSGTVLMDGKPITKAGPERVVIFQQAALFPWLSVLGNVEFGLKMKGVRRERRRELALQALELVNLSKFQDSFVHQLSGGMKQRVALARGLVLDPEILLMDEPFSALDVRSSEALQEEIHRIWWQTKKTILFVTHNVREAARLGDRVLLLSPHPGTIHKEYSVPLAKPRSIDDPGVLDLSRDITGEIKKLQFEGFVGGAGI